MSLFRNFAIGLRSLFRKNQVDRELDEELGAFLEMEAAEKMRQGVSRKDALREVRLERGSLEIAKEVVRSGGWESFVETCWQDLRFGVRMLRKNLGFTTVAILTVALGVGVNTTVFTAFNTLALKPLPVRNPAEVVRLEQWFASGASGDNQYAFSYPEYLNYRDHSRSLKGVIAASWLAPVLATLPTESPSAKTPVEAVTLSCQLVSANYFSVLGIKTVVGQPFAERENSATLASPVVVLSYPYWQRRLNSDRDVVGKILEVNGASFTILGVAREDFIGTGNPPRIPDFWAPLDMQKQIVPGNDWRNEPRNQPLQVIGRVADGISVGQSQSELNLLTRQFAQANPEVDKTIALTLHRATYFGATDELWFRALAAGMMAVVGMVLLVACVNLANMLLARAAGRQKEIATRRALGASRSRLVRQLLTESVLLAMLGGAAGLLFSLWATKLEWAGLATIIQSLMGSGLKFAPLTPDISVFLYTLVLSLVTGILFGLWPALKSSKASLTDVLKDSACGLLPTKSRLRSFMLGTQVAVSIVFLISAGLLLRALFRSQAANPGFETRSVFHLSIDLGDDPVKAAILRRQVIERLKALPEVANVALADRLPYAGTSSRPFLAETRTAAAKGAPGSSLLNYVSPSFFDTVNIPLVRGRTFSPQESEGELPVAIVSESTARHAWPGEDPIGKRLKLDLKFSGDWSTFQVIGVAKDVRFFNLSRTDPAYVYLPANPSQFSSLLFRAAQSRKDTLAAVRSSLSNLDRVLSPTLGFMSLDDFMRSQQLLPQASAVFMGILALLALALAAVGIYGVMAYVVSRRTREVGIRLALGASGGEVLRLLLRQGLIPVFAGAGCGLALSAVVSGLLRTALAFPANPDLLFGVSAFDPAVYAGLTTFLAGVAMLACCVPAWRAMRVDPVVALRYE